MHDVIQDSLFERIGLIVLMFLLGYGLVEFPRTLWTNSNLERRLLRVQQKAASEYKHLQETSLTMSMAVSDAMKTKREVCRSRLI